MMLNFQRQFAPHVLDGTKAQTIRSRGQRRDVPCVGGVAHCFTGLRTRNTVKLGAWPIDGVDVLRMTITEYGHLTGVIVGSSLLRAGEFESFARADGFTSWSAMERWFSVEHGPQEFDGWVIGWRWSGHQVAT